MAIGFPEIDPIIFQIGPIAIRWYGLAYAAGILLGLQYIKRLNQQVNVLDEKGLDSLIIYAVFGIIIGGRLGYVLFYNAGYYFENPLQALYIWEGGMSFHGGVLGMMAAMFLLAKKYTTPFLGIMDKISAAAPIGLFFGRVANFINAELYGKPTDVPWAVNFPNVQHPRHPSQLYEAGLEGLLLFIIIFWAIKNTDAHKRTGMISGIFLAGYGLSRGFVEFFRQPDAHIGYVFDVITMGQILSVPMILVGVLLILRAKKNAS